MENAENVLTLVFEHEDKIHIKNEIKQEIKSEPLSEDEVGDTSNICFDYEDNIPIKKEIKQEIKSEILYEAEEVHDKSNDDSDQVNVGPGNGS